MTVVGECERVNLNTAGYPQYVPYPADATLSEQTAVISIRKHKTNVVTQFELVPSGFFLLDLHPSPRS